MGFGKFASLEGCSDPDAAVIMSGPPIIIYGQKVGPTIVFKPLRQTEGKYYYECKTVLGGHMQIGWADDSFKADGESGKGCGDEAHSWAFDGNRALKWHAGKNESIGCKWKAGDVIGVAVDLDKKEICFSLNGDWNTPGVAFQSFTPDGGIYPCLSILYGERLELYFGTEDNPFIHCPPEGFQPLLLHGISNEGEEVIDRKYEGYSQIIQLGLSEQSTDNNFTGAMLVTQMRKTLEYETRKNALVQHGYEFGIKQLEKDYVTKFAKQNKLTNDEILSVITYTLEEPRIYNYFNDASRKGSAVNNFPIMFYLLSQACKKINYGSGQPGVEKTVYRGISFKCKSEVGQFIRFGSFTSTTGNINIANKFRKKNGTMFIIQCKLGASIKDVSDYPNEDEVLVPPFEKFQVDHTDEPTSTIYLSSALTDEYIDTYFKSFIDDCQK